MAQLEAVAGGNAGIGIKDRIESVRQIAHTAAKIGNDKKRRQVVQARDAQAQEGVIGREQWRGSVCRCFRGGIGGDWRERVSRCHRGSVGWPRGGRIGGERRIGIGRQRCIGIGGHRRVGIDRNLGSSIARIQCGGIGRCLRGGVGRRGSVSGGDSRLGRGDSSVGGGDSGVGGGYSGIRRRGSVSRCSGIGRRDSCIHRLSGRERITDTGRQVQSQGEHQAKNARGEKCSANIPTFNKCFHGVPAFLNVLIILKSTLTN